MSLWSGRAHTPPPPLENPFFEVLREVGAGWRGSKNDPPPFFGVENNDSFGFFHFERKKCFRVPTPWGFYGAEWDERYMLFSAIFAMLAVLATSGTPWYPL